MALRGDRRAVSRITRRRAHGFACAAELVQGLAAVAPFEIPWPLTRKCIRKRLRGGGPRQPEAQDRRRAARHPQFFYDGSGLRFRKPLRRGPDPTIVPGILPITRFPQVLRFAQACGASIPQWLHERFAGLDDDHETRRMIAASVAIEQVEELTRHGVREFHFYTLNRAELTYAICYALGLRPAAAAARTKVPA